MNVCFLNRADPLLLLVLLWGYEGQVRKSRIETLAVLFFAF
jgi:hypothetical protein